MRIVRSEKEIDEVLNVAAMGMDRGSAYPGMSFEEGIAEGIRWLTEEGQDPPFEDHVIEEYRREYG